MVLCAGTDQADAPDVDLLDDLGPAAPLGYGGLKGVEVHDHQVDRGDLELLQLGHVTGQVAPAKDAAEDLGVERLDPPPQDARIGGEVLHRGGRHAQAFDEFLCATGGVEMHTQTVQFLHDGLQPVLMDHRNERALNAFLPVQCDLAAW